MEAGDALTQSLSRLQNATGSVERAGAICEALYCSALSTGVALSESVGAFQRFSIAAREIGATSDQVVRLFRGRPPDRGPNSAESTNAAAKAPNTQETGTPSSRAIGDARVASREYDDAQESVCAVPSAIITRRAPDGAAASAVMRRAGAAPAASSAAARSVLVIG
ncbi:hypothetical protein [Falsiroseomonas sp.]|uniref:hypothetical protein n=1 Tax=Falsiroseomonas sp. TaxID=2870721 RepID=UPI0035647470